MSIGGDEGDVTEELGDLSGPPLPLGLCLQHGEDACHTVADLTGTDYHEALRTGAVDLALGRFHDSVPADLVQGPVMSREQWLLGVARDHPLAGQGDVSVEVLATHPIFGTPDAVTGELHNPLYPANTPQGEPIPRRGVARTFTEVLALVARQETSSRPPPPSPATTPTPTWSSCRSPAGPRPPGPCAGAGTVTPRRSAHSSKWRPPSPPPFDPVTATGGPARARRGAAEPVNPNLPPAGISADEERPGSYTTNLAERP